MRHARCRQRTLSLTFVLAIIGTPLSAQLPRITVPAGAFRFEAGVTLRNADSRYNDGVTEDLARSFTASPLGSGFFPSLAPAEDAIARITGLAAYQLSAGATSMNGVVNITEGNFGLAYGLTSRLTLSVRVPIVRTRAQIAPRYSSATANAGLNPADPVFGSAAGQSQTSTFFTELDASLTTLAAKLAAGDYSGDPALTALAQSALNSGQTLRNDLGAVFNNPASFFVPTAASTAGVAVTDSLTTFQSTLSGPLGVSGFTSRPALATGPIDLATFQGIISTPSGPIAGFPLRETTINRMGDVELGAAYSLLDRWNRPDNPGGIRATAELRVLLPTAQQDRPDNFIDVPTGDRVFAVGARATLDIGRGSFGARIEGEHLRRFSKTIVRRISPPSQPIPFLNRTANVSQNLGDVTSITVQPFYRLGPTMALQAGVQYWTRSDDAVTYASDGDSIPGTRASLLADGTGASMLRFVTGIRYATRAVDEGGEGLPVEADWLIEGPLSGSGGIVWKERVMRVRLRLYGRL